MEITDFRDYRNRYWDLTYYLVCCSSRRQRFRFHSELTIKIVFQAGCRSSYKKHRRTAAAASVDGVGVGGGVTVDRCSRELSSSISRKSNWEVIEHYNTR